MMWKTTGDWQTGTARTAMDGFTYDFKLRRDYKQE